MRSASCLEEKRGSLAKGLRKQSRTETGASLDSTFRASQASMLGLKTTDPDAACCTIQIILTIIMMIMRRKTEKVIIIIILTIIIITNNNNNNNNDNNNNNKQ